jgi:hypothetical protein
VGVLGSLLAPRLSLLVGGRAAVLTGWGLRFRPSPISIAAVLGLVVVLATGGVWYRLRHRPREAI